MSLLGGLLLLVGCSREPTDAERLRAALAGQGTVEEQGALCEPITDPGMRDECLLAVAVGAEELRQSACDSIEDRHFRNECLFQVAEAQGKRGEFKAAIAGCHRAGPYKRNCAVHVAQELARQGVASWQEEGAEAAIAKVNAFLPVLAQALQNAELVVWTSLFHHLWKEDATTMPGACAVLDDEDLCRVAVDAHLERLAHRRCRSDGLDAQEAQRRCEESDWPDYRSQVPGLTAALNDHAARRCLCPDVGGEMEWTPRFHDAWVMGPG